MATKNRKKAAAPDRDAEAPKTSKVPEPEEVSNTPTTESPISTTGAMHVFRTDLGESLPPQKKAGVE